MRSTIVCVTAALAISALTACRSLTPAIDVDKHRIYPQRNYSGWYDPYFGAGGKQLTDFAWVGVARPIRMSDAVRFLHRRQDGNYLAIGRSEECDTDWNEVGGRDGCRDVASLALYNRDGVRIDSVGMRNLRGLAGYTDTVDRPVLSGLTYFSVADIRVNPNPTLEQPTIPWSELPHSTLAQDSYLHPNGTALVLAEEDFRNSNCINYEQPHQPEGSSSQPCWHWRKGAILGFDQNLNLDLKLLLASRSALTNFANAALSQSQSRDGFEGNCEKTYFSTLAANADRIFIGGHREDRCVATVPPKFMPFVIALRLDGTRDLGFGTGGIWSPAWPQNEGGVISDLQLDTAGNLLVLAGRWVAPNFTTTVMSVSPLGQLRAGFGSNGELQLADVQFDPFASNMKLALAANQTAYVFSRYGRQVARIQDVARGLRDTTYGPAGSGVYAAEPDLASLPAFAATGAPRVVLHDIVPVCSNGVALVGTTLQPRSWPMAIVLNRNGRRANNVRDAERMLLNPGVVFDNYAGMMPHTRWGFGYAAMFDSHENKLLIGGSAGSEQAREHDVYLPLFDFAISARQIRCVDVD